MSVSSTGYGHQPHPTSYVLDGIEVAGITPELRPPSRSTGTVKELNANKLRCFQGPIPAGAGFVISAEEAEHLLGRSDTDYGAVVRPYLTGDDIADDPRQQPRRWIIDFARMRLEDARSYPAALDIVREHVKPIRDGNNREAYRRNWWLFAEPRRDMRAALTGLPRFITSNRSASVSCSAGLLLRFVQAILLTSLHLMMIIRLACLLHSYTKRGLDHVPLRWRTVFDTRLRPCSKRSHGPSQSRTHNVIGLLRLFARFLNGAKRSAQRITLA